MNAKFNTTNWSKVSDAASSPDSTIAQTAWDHLAQFYWYPLYAHARGRGLSSEDAQDLTQSFFLTLLEKNLLARACRTRGRFRTFMLSAFINHVRQAVRCEAALKRGGGCWFISLDVRGAEERYAGEPIDSRDPEQLFERRWAFNVLEAGFARLEKEYAACGHAGLFCRLVAYLQDDRDSPRYAEIAAALGMTEGAVRLAAHRMRNRLSVLIREELARSVPNATELEQELRHFIQVLSSA